MRKIILQHCTVEQQHLLDISKPINVGYAERLGYEYRTDSTRRCPERSIYWEKIAYLRATLPGIDDGSLVVWEDADSINVKDCDFEDALPTGVLGLVQNRAGVDCKRLIPWYNAGVMVMRNGPVVRDFFDRVWARPDDTDEAAIVAELKHNGWAVGGGVPVTSMDPKWNCWKNNVHLCADPVVKSWHGVKLAEKLPEIRGFMGTWSRPVHA